MPKVRCDGVPDSIRGQENRCLDFPRCRWDVVTRQGAKKVRGWSDDCLNLLFPDRPFFLLSESAREDFCDANDPNSPFDCVVVGYAPSAFTYDNLNTAFRILVGESTVTADDRHPPPSKPIIPLIATHKARYLATSGGLLSLGPGPFVAALENAACSTAEVVGKPTRSFFETVIGNFDHDELVARDSEIGRIAVIGDDVEADLGEGAVELGLWRVLGEHSLSIDFFPIFNCNDEVKTGKYRPGDESRAGIQPADELFESFAACVDDLLASQLSVRSRNLTL